MIAFGAATNLVAGTITLTLPSGTRYWWIQNQDTAPLKITFPNGSGFGPVCLGAASATGASGEWIDSIGFPIFETVVLTSSVTTAQFGAGATSNRPVNETKGFDS